MKPQGKDDGFHHFNELLRFQRTLIPYLYLVLALFPLVRLQVRPAEDPHRVLDQLRALAVERGRVGARGGGAGGGEGGRGLRGELVLLGAPAGFLAGWEMERPDMERQLISAANML